MPSIMQHVRRYGLITYGKRHPGQGAMMEASLTVFWYAYVIAYATAAPRSPEILLKSVRLALGIGASGSNVGRSSHRSTSALRLMPGQ